ncbi:MULTISPECIES: hypothetical protein [Kitasatospora]|uniref:Uncharacterized protein n=1 Tax=Kitasatospora cathayae TaxID=3004092 RepID=A0ABY7PWE6_9ACTN|nr:hypothetical protein [Kitasatospora sp. HUAS 3-15]WBP84691.1 hypothetical protein O1G21_01710 [Kitasatospora sp. HUAS 3-15]
MIRWIDPADGVAGAGFGATPVIDGFASARLDHERCPATEEP